MTILSCHNAVDSRVLKFSVTDTNAHFDCATVLIKLHITINILYSFYKKGLFWSFHLLDSLVRHFHILCWIFNSRFNFNSIRWLDVWLLCYLECAGGNCTNRLHTLLAKHCLASKSRDWAIVQRQIHRLRPTPLQQSIKIRNVKTIWKNTSDSKSMLLMLIFWIKRNPN